MSNIVELPLIEPLFSTYHYQGSSTSIISSNPTVRNWYLNEKVNLNCTRRFLSGFTTPEISIPGTSWHKCPYFESIWISSRFTGGYINVIIRKMLDEGYYIVFNGVDDYYVKGKSWYHERHFNHDGLICGYNQENKTYCLYSYDNKWRYRKFWTPQSSFNKARRYVEKQGTFPGFCALKVKGDNIQFSPQTVYDKLKEYLDSDLKKYPFKGDGIVSGIAVHAFIAKYVARLHKGDIPYERMDRRVFRVIWEHKKVMQERIELIEKSLGLNDMISKKYVELVKEADTMRMLYACHHMKRRDSVLPIIEKKLLKLMQDERKLLNKLLKIMEREFENGAVEISEK